MLAWLIVFPSRSAASRTRPGSSFILCCDAFVLRYRMATNQPSFQSSDCMYVGSWVSRPFQSDQLEALREVRNELIVGAVPRSLVSQEQQQRVDEQLGVNGQMRVEPVVLALPLDVEGLGESHVVPFVKPWLAAPLQRQTPPTTVALPGALSVA
jgi:hypothetical protein